MAKKVARVDGTRQVSTPLNLLNFSGEPAGQSDPVPQDRCYLLRYGYTSFDLSAGKFYAILHAAWDLLLFSGGKEKHNIIGITLAVNIADA
jgi:hypothetical protein